MPVRRLEALADAITRLSDWFNPESSAYQNRNPGALRPHSVKKQWNADGDRVFPSYIDGYQALLFDLGVKCSGISRTRLKRSSTIADLVRALGWSADTAPATVVSFLRRALRDKTIRVSTPLSFFL